MNCDYSLLRPDITLYDVISKFNMLPKNIVSIFVKPCYLDLTRNLVTCSLTKIKLGTVVGFPDGASPNSIKIAEIKEAQKNGASEIDLILNLSYIKSGQFSLLQNDVLEIVDYAHQNDLCINLVADTKYLNKYEKSLIYLIYNTSMADTFKDFNVYNIKTA